MQNQNEPMGADYGAYAAAPNFTKHLHKHGKSGLFLAGIILFTLGSVLMHVMAYGFFAIFTLLVGVLPIIGFWLIFAESRAGYVDSTSKTKAALTLFKVHTIIAIVGLALIALLVMGLFALVLAIGAELGDDALVAVLAVVMIVSVGVLLVLYAIFIIFYYVPIFRILKSIKQNIESNIFAPIRGVLPFTIVTCIIVGFGLLGVVWGLASMGFMAVAVDELMWVMDDLMWELSPYIPGIYDFGLVGMLDFLMASMVFTYVFSLINMAGVILCTVTLNKFARNMPSR